MSENIPESIPTSQDHRSQRPVKKARGPMTASASQSNAIEALFAKQPDIQIPETSTVAKRQTLAPPPEIVANVQGSSAGAGSGEFHVYKASRRREYERIRLMEQEAKEEQETKQWEANKEERERRDAEKLSKNKRRREKAKARKDKGKGGDAHGQAEDGKTGVRGPNPMLARRAGEEDEDEGPHGSVVPEETNGIVIHDDE